MENIKIKYFDGAEPIAQIENGDWIDLRANETHIVPKGTFFLIPLGVAMKLPEGYEALVAPRSSTFKNYGIIMTNSIGIIDESYCGDEDQWMFPAYSMRNTVINKGDRIAQFRIIKHQPEIELEKVERLKGENRGGFGSTGVN